MAEQIGIITAIDPGGWAKVLSDRKGACGGCHPGHGGCRSCLAGSKFESRVTNTIGAQPGDLVKVRLNSSNFFRGAALLYLLPIVALVIGAFLGAWGGGQIGWQQTTGAVLGAFTGIGIAILILIRLDRSRSARRSLTPTIVEILPDWSSPTQAPRAKHACCG
jgi:sigma-E factor negative regulatory protein RseC